VASWSIKIAGALDKLLASRHVKGELTHQTCRAANRRRYISSSEWKTRTQDTSVQSAILYAGDSERLKDRVPDIKGQPYSRFAIEVSKMSRCVRCMPRRATPPKDWTSSPHMQGNANDPGGQI